MTDPLHEALTTLAAGGMVLVADEHDRENEGDLVMAASVITTEQMVFFLRHGSGIVCTPMSASRADELGLPMMVDRNTDNHTTAFTVTVDHSDTGTGISAADRALTVRSLADPATGPADLRRPGHLFPLRSVEGGVLKRAGHTEAATDLLAMAGAGEVAVITELVGDDGVPLAGEQLREFAERHGVPFLHIEDLVRARRHSAALVTRSGRADLPLRSAQFESTAYRSVLDGVEHLALTLGDIAAADAGPDGVLVRVHSECLTGDVFGSRRCDCGEQLQEALDLITAEGAGIVVYLRGHEGRGVGLEHTMQTYDLPDPGHDTVDAATIAVGPPADAREYGIGAAILADLGVHRLRLITNYPHEYTGLAGFDLQLAGRVATRPSVTTDNISHLRAKRDRMGHLSEVPTAKAQQTH